MGPRLCISVLLALALVGCGRESSAPSAGDGTSPIEHRPEDVASISIPEELARIAEPWTGDLDGMVERNLVRAAVARSGFFYYIRKGREYGLTLDFLRLFEQHLNDRLGLKGTRRIHVVAVPMTRDLLLQAVAEGRADIAAAGLTVTEARSRIVDFSDPWITDVNEVVVMGPLATPVHSFENLRGREVVVRVSSSYYESLVELDGHLRRSDPQPINIVPAHEIFEDEDLLEMVSVGMIPITVSDDYIAEFWAQVFDGLVIRRDLPVRTSGRIAWAFRKKSPELAAAINEFVAENRPGTRTGNILLRRYLDNPVKVTNALAGDQLAQLSTEEPYFRKYGEESGFDWLMLAAQGYQESKLDNSRRSKAGAVGIMQVLPTTATSLGVKNYQSVEGNIKAGAMYMRYLVDTHFADPSLDPMNRWIFALAAYNAGGTRIAKMRRKAEKDGLDPNLWFDNVETEVARQVGSEPVNYVRNVMKYYLAYRLTFEREQLKRDVLAKLSGAE